MRKLILPLALMLPMMAMADTYTVTSPNGLLVVNVNLNDGRLTYDASLDGKQMLAESQLGLLTDLDDFTQQLKAVGTKTDTRNKHYTMKNAKASAITYNANTFNLTVSSPKGFEMTVLFEVSDNSVAYAYEMPKFDKVDRRVVRIFSEASSFRFPDHTTTFLTPQITPRTGWMRSKPSYEEEYEADQPMTKASKFGVGYTFPALFRVGDDGWALVSETGVSSTYCGSRLSDFDAKAGYTIAFPQEDENNGFGSAYAAMGLPAKTPWRTITLGKTLAPVIENTTAYDLVDPLYEPSEDYKPGRYVWSWLIWQDNSANYDDQVKFINVASEFGYEYILVDGLWDQQMTRQQVAELSKYAQSKGVHLMLWYNSNGVANDAPQTPRNIMSNSILRKKEMKWMQSLGVKGIKVDFFGGDKQETMRLYEDILSDANEYGIQVIFHGCTIPRGWERMYPNYVGSEAALASENVFFSDYHAQKEGFEMNMYPYTRNAVAAFDWGGVIMNRFMSPDNKKRHSRKTTDCFELATAITNQSSINCMMVTPESLPTIGADVHALLTRMPTTWDETRFIDGYPGRYTVIARKDSKSGKWYVGGINGTDEPARKLTISLPMLAGKKVRVFSDDKNREPICKEMAVSKKGTITIQMPTMGGFVVEEM